MHATQPQGGACPEPHRDSPESAGFLAGLLTNPGRFRTWLASATLTAAQPPAVPDETASDGYLLTDAGRAALGEPASAASDSTLPVTDNPVAVEPGAQALRWRDKDPAQMTDAEFEIWSEEQDDGYAERERDAYIARQEAADEAPGTAASVLRSAALYLERYGWITGAYYDATTGTFTPPACMVGAIGMVCYGGPVDAPAQHFDNPGFLDFEEAVLHLDRYLLVENGSESYEFNDARGRTVDQVTDVLRKAAARPDYELIDALRVIDAKNADVAALVGQLKPGGTFALACPTCGSEGRKDRRFVAVKEGYGSCWCADSWHDRNSIGGDVA